MDVPESAPDKPLIAQTGAKPSLTETFLPIAKDAITVLVSVIASVYVLGYVCRESAILSFGVGEVTITRESAVLSGVVYIILMFAAFSPYVLYSAVYKRKIDRGAWIKPVGSIVVAAFSVPIAISYMSRGAVETREFLYATGQVFFSGFALRLYGFALINSIRRKDTYDLATSTQSIVLLIISVFTFGRIVLPNVDVRYGGFDGSRVRVLTSGPLGTFEGKLVCEDAGWSVFKTRDSGSYSVFRVSKADIKAIENIDPFDKPKVVLATKATENSK